MIIVLGLIMTLAGYLAYKANHFPEWTAYAIVVLLCLAAMQYV